MPQLAFKNVKTGKIFEVVKLDKAAGTITLKGEGTEFTEPYDKAAFKEWGYELVQLVEEAPDEDEDED